MGVICTGVARGACLNPEALCHHTVEHELGAECRVDPCTHTSRNEYYNPVKPKAHAAKLENSPRLQRIVAVLQRGGWWATRAIIQQAHVCGAYAWELRANGLDVECRLLGVNKETKAKVYQYRLVTPGKGEQSNACAQ